MPPIVVPVIVGDRVTEQVGVDLVLELAQGKTVEEVSPKKPLLRDAFIRDIYGLYEMRAASGQRVDEDLLKAVLARRAAGILGPGVVHQVLIQRLFEQRR